MIFSLEEITANNNENALITNSECNEQEIEEENKKDIKIQLENFNTMQNQ